MAAIGKIVCDLLRSLEIGGRATLERTGLGQRQRERGTVGRSLCRDFLRQKQGM